MSDRPEDDKPDNKKPEYVDLFEETLLPSPQRSAQRVAIEPEVKDKRRLSHWPPTHLEDWRAETLAPWRLRSRKKDWD